MRPLFFLRIAIASALETRRTRERLRGLTPSAAACRRALAVASDARTFIMRTDSGVWDRERARARRSCVVRGVNPPLERMDGACGRAWFFWWQWSLCLSRSPLGGMQVCPRSRRASRRSSGCTPFDPKTSLVVVTPGRVFGNVRSRDPAAQSTAGSVHSAVEVILL